MANQTLVTVAVVTAIFLMVVVSILAILVMLRMLGGTLNKILDMVAEEETDITPTENHTAHKE